MRVVLFRHGPAGRRDASRWPDDAKRPLTPRGESRTSQAAAGLARMLGKGPLTVLTSPLLRCTQTAELLFAVAEKAELVPFDSLAPGGSPRQVLRFLAQRSSGETVVLVGHEPDLGKLAGTLLFGAPAPLGFKKAGACLIEFVAEVTPGSGHLRWFLPPRLLRRLAGKKVAS